MQLEFIFDSRYDKLDKLMIKATCKDIFDFAFTNGVPNIHSLKCSLYFTPDKIPTKEIGLPVVAYQMTIFDQQAIKEIYIKYSFPLDALEGMLQTAQADLLSHEIAHACFAILKYYTQAIENKINVRSILVFSNNAVHVIENASYLKSAFTDKKQVKNRFFINKVIINSFIKLTVWDYLSVYNSWHALEIELNQQRNLGTYKNPLW